MSRLQAREVFRDGRRRLIAVESIELHHRREAAGGWLHGTVTPVALIIHSPEQTRAVDMAARPLDLEQLGRDTPGLEAMLYRD